VPAATEGLAAPPARRTLLDRVFGSWLFRRVLAIPLVDRLLSPARGDKSFNRFVRYSVVSAVAIVISQVVILLCAWLGHLPGVVANAIGAAASTPASYELNRKWAWGKKGKSHMWREVMPFWALTILGLLASTGTVQVADSMAHAHHLVGLGRAGAIMGASLFAYGVVWVVKFVVFNRIVFAVSAHHHVEGRDVGAEPRAAGSSQPFGSLPASGDCTALAACAADAGEAVAGTAGGLAASAQGTPAPAAQPVP